MVFTLALGSRVSKNDLCLPEEIGGGRQKGSGDKNKNMWGSYFYEVVLVEGRRPQHFLMSLSVSRTVGPSQECY